MAETLERPGKITRFVLDPTALYFRFVVTCFKRLYVGKETAQRELNEFPDCEV